MHPSKFNKSTGRLYRTQNSIRRLSVQWKEGKKSKKQVKQLGNRNRTEEIRSQYTDNYLATYVKNLNSLIKGQVFKLD